MATITHATSPSGSDDPAYGVSKSEWDEAHTVSDIAEADLAAALALKLVAAGATHDHHGTGGGATLFSGLAKITVTSGSYPAAPTTGDLCVRTDL